MSRGATWHRHVQHERCMSSAMPTRRLSTTLTVIFARALQAAAGAWPASTGLSIQCSWTQRCMQVQHRRPPPWGCAARVARCGTWPARRRPPRPRAALPRCLPCVTSVLYDQENNSFQSGLAPRRELGPPRAAPCDRPGWCCGPCEGERSRARMSCSPCGELTRASSYYMYHIVMPFSQ